jgi:hypothetical protein
MVGFHAFRNCAAVYWGMIKQVRFYRAVSNVKCCNHGSECNGDVTTTTTTPALHYPSWHASGRKNSLPSEPRISPHARWSWCELRHSLSGSRRRNSYETASNTTSERPIRAAEFPRRRLPLILVLIGESCVRGKWNDGLNACRCISLKNRSVRKY